MKSEFATWNKARECFQEIQNTLKRELSLATLLVLNEKERQFYAPTEPHFGSEVASKFQRDAAFEIDEAGKCLALGRSTAAVFHLMRVMEIGIGAVRCWLGVPDPIKRADRNWGKILEQVKSEMDRRVAAKTWKSKEDRELCEAAYASLDAVKTAWRNPTMHVENKYTPDEAEHIFIAVKGFMKKLASRMDEEGNPRA